MTKTIFELTEGSAPLLTDYALNGEDPAGNHVLRRTTWQSILNLFTSKQADGWIGTDNIFNYASANSFTVSGDVRSIYQIGDKIKLTQTTVKYFYIIDISYTSPNTTISVTGGTDYSLANASITSPFYSHASTAVGFPSLLNWVGSSGSNPQGLSGIAEGNVFFLANRTVNLFVNITGTSIATSFSITLPVKPAHSNPSIIRATNNTSTITWGLANAIANSTSLSFFTSADGLLWTSSGTKQVFGLVQYTI